MYLYGSGHVQYRAEVVLEMHCMPIHRALVLLPVFFNVMMSDVLYIIRQITSKE